MSNLDDERWIDTEYLQICINILNEKRKVDAMKEQNKMEVFKQR